MHGAQGCPAWKGSVGGKKELEAGHRNMNSKEGATLLTMQQPKNSQKREDMT